MPTNGLLGMIAAVLGLLWMLHTCASITKEKFDKALAKEIKDDEA